MWPPQPSRHYGAFPFLLPSCTLSADPCSSHLWIDSYGMKCECTLAGFCNRHGVNKTARMIELCRSDPSYWRAWEESRGPGQVSDAPFSAQEPIATCEYNHWAPLHFFAVKHVDDWNEEKARDFFHHWQQGIPNTHGCSCKAKWQALGLNPDFASPRAFFEWTVHAHNTVSELPGVDKPRYTIDQAYEIWWRGCDVAEK